MREKIKNYVHETMKNYDVNDRKLAKELISACCDEYEMQLSNGAGEEEAYSAAVANIEEIVKSKVSPRNKFTFALGMGVFALLLSVAEMIASLLVRNIEFYSVEIPAVWLGFGVIIILYLIFKRRSYRWFDFVVLGVLILSWFATLYQLLGAFLFNYTPGSYNDLNFIFPCIFDYRVHREWMGDGVYSTASYFYSNFLVSLAVFITTFALFIRQKFKLKAKLALEEK